MLKKLEKIKEKVLTMYKAISILIHTYIHTYIQKYGQNWKEVQLFSSRTSLYMEGGKA